MIKPPGLTLLDAIVDEHLHDRGSALIPCVHESLEQDVALLAAGAERIGGALFDLDSNDWDPPGPLIHSRADIIRTMLNGSGALPAAVTFSDTPSGVKANMVGAPKAEPSLQILLRAAALIASSAYDGLDLVMVCVDTSPLDATRRPLLWSLLTLDPASLGLASRTTIVPIVGAQLDPALDYARRPIVRYVIRSDRVIRRAPVTVERMLHHAATRSEPLVLFLGAGASASSGVRLGNWYRDLALRDFVDDSLPGSQVTEAFFDYLHERNHFLPGESGSRQDFARDLTLERVLYETFLDLGTRSRESSAVIQELIRDCTNALNFDRAGRRAIRELAKALHGRLIIITVNFDQLIEEGIGVPINLMYRPEHFRDGLASIKRYLDGDSAEALPILKIHGSVAEPDSLIATIDSTSAGLNDYVREALNAIVADQSVTWVWVGCSMRDRDVTQWLGGLPHQALDEWWVDPLPGDSLDSFINQHRLPRWKASGMTLQDRLIIDSADGFLSALAAKLG